MASYWTNRGKARLVSGGITGKTLRVILVDAAPASAAAAADLNTPSQIVADEISGTGYSRKTIIGLVSTEDDTNDRALLDADDLTPYTAISAGTIAGAWVVEQVGGTDADATDHLWMFLDVADIVTNGGTVTLQFNVLGLSTIA